MGFHHSFDDGEPNSGAFDTALVSGRAAHELAKHSPAFVTRHPWTTIFNTNSDHRSARFNLDRHWRLPGGVLERVVEEVAYRRSHCRAISTERGTGTTHRDP